MSNFDKLDQVCLLYKIIKNVQKPRGPKRVFDNILVSLYIPKWPISLQLVALNSPTSHLKFVYIAK